MKQQSLKTFFQRNLFTKSSSWDHSFHLFQPCYSFEKLTNKWFKKEFTNYMETIKEKEMAYSVKGSLIEFVDNINNPIV